MGLPTAPTRSSAVEHRAVLMLLVACVLWGMSFNWNKDGQALLGEHLGVVMGNPDAASVAPALLLALRFLAAIVLWACLFPRCLRGWTMRTVRGGIAGGTLLSGGILLQHYGLAHTTESLSSFLTSLTILFTPLLAALVLRQRIGAVMWASVAFATAGVALMTIYRAEGQFDRGALLGLLCAVVFSGHILVVDHVGKREDSFRFTLAQLIVGCTIFWVFCASWSQRLPSAGQLIEAFSDTKLLALAGLSTVFSTVVTFGLMFRFQPRTTATRAALIYMTEPLFATVYAWLLVGRTIGAVAILGGALIIAGNVLAELFGRRFEARDSFVTRPATYSDK